MTKDEVKAILKIPYKLLVLTALSYVNLTDRELNILILRYMRGKTQQETAEELFCTVNGLQKWEKIALDKCRQAWEKLIFVQELIKAVQ